MKKMKFILAILLLVNIIAPIGCAKTEYMLTIDINGQGIIAPAAAANHTLEKGKSVNITAYPARGWKFDGWGGDTSGTVVTLLVNMDKPQNIQANFSKATDKLYSLTIVTNGDGNVTPAAGRHAYTDGSVITIISNPGAGSQFDRWNGPVTSTTSARTTVTMNQDKTVTVYFVKTPINFGPEIRDIGTGSGLWNVSLKSEDQVKFTFVVTGADVTYSVKDPNNKTVLASPAKGQNGQGIFTATASGNYQIMFVSTSKVTKSILTLSYVIYPKP